MFLDRRIVNAPRFQFGLLNYVATLNCSVDRPIQHITTWYNNSERFNGSIGKVGLHHEGQYMCEVHLSDINLFARNSVQFTVIGEQTHS